MSANLTLVVANTSPTVEVYKVEDLANGVNYVLAQDGASTSNPTALSIQIDYTSFYERIASALETIASNSTEIKDRIDSMNTTLAIISSEIQTIDSTLSSSSANLAILTSEIQTIDTTLGNVSANLASINTSTIASTANIASINTSLISTAANLASINASSSNLSSKVSLIEQHLDADFSGSYANNAANSHVDLSDIAENLANVNLNLETNGEFLRFISNHFQVERALMVVSDIQEEDRADIRQEIASPSAGFP